MELHPVTFNLPFLKTVTFIPGEISKKRPGNNSGSYEAFRGCFMLRSGKLIEDSRSIEPTKLLHLKCVIEFLIPIFSKLTEIIFEHSIASSLLFEPTSTTLPDLNKKAVVLR